MKFNKLSFLLCATIVTAAIASFVGCANPGDNTTPQEPPEDYVDVFIFMGQSNMSGQGKADEAIECPEGHGYEYRAVSGNGDDGWLYPVREPFGVTERNEAIGDSRAGGLVSSFCESYYQSSGVPVVGVTASISGSAISQWEPGQKAYKEAVARLNSCVSYLEEQSDMTVRSINMVWCQGESDAYRTYYKKYDYIGKLKSVFGGMSSEAAVEKCFIITPSIYSNNTARIDKQALTEKQVQLCRDDEDFVLAARKFENVPLILRDDPHFRQGVYNVAGWEAGKTAATYIETGVELICDVYNEGEAEELAEQFGITLSYNPKA